jgi:predicted ATP-dependent endonuclease of OLD family
MMQYLRRMSANCQIFLTTHSTNFLDIADLRNVYLVKRDPSTQAQLLDVDEAEEAIPQELGIRLSSLFMYDRLVFVEGPSDEQVLRAFASTISVNLSRTGVGFVTTGGARNFTHYANAATLNFLAKRRVRLYFILDRDERDLPEIEKLREQLGALGELKVLNRREIENYLLEESSLARYIAQKGAMDSTPSSGDIKEFMADAARELLVVAIERRVLKAACRPIIPNRAAVLGRGEIDFVAALSEQLENSEKQVATTRETIEERLGEVRSELESLSPEKLLDVIPGDALIDAIFQKYGLRFNKRKDAPKLAAGMRPNEIPDEIKKLLNQLGE